MAVPKDMSRAAAEFVDRAIEGLQTNYATGYEHFDALLDLNTRAGDIDNRAVRDGLYAAIREASGGIAEQNQRSFIIAMMLVFTRAKDYVAANVWSERLKALDDDLKASREDTREMPAVSVRSMSKK